MTGWPVAHITWPNSGITVDVQAPAATTTMSATICTPFPSSTPITREPRSMNRCHGALPQLQIRGLNHLRQTLQNFATLRPPCARVEYPSG